ncbi:MAG TPA: thiamine pyrophosphate-dependent dehydrogenase E1 component subunit alpha [Azospirillum sp.]|nr:thiamine pyrophosphate-dependent dehydrogenase E1 component subunit alpha [Azospirillum sp.]
MSDFDGQTALELFRAMLRIRLVEEAVALRYGELEMRCPIHLSVGQEAVAVGLCAELRRTDQVLSTHRCHAHYLAKGGDLRAMIAELYGRETGCCGGRGGSMNLHEAEAGLLLSSPTIGSAIPVAVGAALAMRQAGQDGVAVTFFGDGAAEEGVLHEAMNFAALRSLPVLFVLENNLWSIVTALEQRQPGRPLADLARAHGIPAETVDGNDVLAMRAAAARAVARGRRGEGPGFLVCDTYRLRDHCEHTLPLPEDAATKAERAAWRERCPIQRLRRPLVQSGVLTEAAEEAMAVAILAEIDDAFTFARTSPFPTTARVEETVYV